MIVANIAAAAVVAAAVSGGRAARPAAEDSGSYKNSGSYKTAAAAIYIRTGSIPVVGIHPRRLFGRAA